MIQRSNGSPGTTKEVRYVISGKTQQERLRDLVELCNAMIEPPYHYILKDFGKKIGTETEYYARFLSKQKGLKD